MSASCLTVGVVFQQFGWHATSRTHTYDGRGSLDVALAFASQVFHLDHASTVRVCKGVVIMPALAQHKGSQVIARCRGGGVSDVVNYSLRGNDVYVFASYGVST